MSRTHRTSWNFATNLIFTAVSLVTGLISVPLLLRWLGDEKFGAFRAAVEWSAYLALFELGLGGALQPMLARAAASGDRNDVLRILSAAIGRYKIVAYAMLAAGIVLTIPLPWLEHVGPDLRMSLWIGFLINLLGIPMVIFWPFRSLADATQRGYYVNLLLLVQTIVITTLYLVFAKLGWGLIGQFIGLVTGNIIFGLLLAWDAHKHYPGAVKLVFKTPEEREIRKDLVKLSWPTLTLNICGRVGLLTDNILITFFMGPILLVPFIVTQRLSSLAQNQVQAVGNATWAALAELHARGEHDLFRKRLIELTGLVSVLAVASLGPIAAYNHFFVETWVQKERYAGDIVTLLAVSNGFVWAIISLWGWVFNGTGRVALLVPVAITSATINFIISVIGAWLFGWPGPLLGTFVGLYGVTSVGYAILLRRHYSISIGALVKGPLVALATGIPYTAALWWIAHNHYPPGWDDQRFHHIFRWLGLAVEMAAAAGVYLLFAWFVILSSADRAFWLHRFAIIFRRKAAAQTLVEK